MRPVAADPGLQHRLSQFLDRNVDARYVGFGTSELVAAGMPPWYLEFDEASALHHRYRIAESLMKGPSFDDFASSFCPYLPAQSLSE